MAITSPTTEQLRFRSSQTGIHNLDAYLEATEKGGRTLHDLLDDIFDSNGDVDPNIFQFRVDPTTYALQVRNGVFTNPNAGWNNVPDGSFFNPTGQFQIGYNYEIHDLFNFSDSLYMVTTAHTSGATPDLTKCFLAVAGNGDAVPATRLQLSGHEYKYLRVRGTQDGYDLVGFTDTNVFIGLKQEGNTISVDKIGVDKTLSEGAVLQSLLNKTKGIVDGLSGFWDKTYTDAGGTFKFYDFDRNTNGTPDIDDVVELSKLVRGVTYFGPAYTAWNNDILPLITEADYGSLIIPFDAGADYNLFSETYNPNAASANVDDYLTWTLGNGNTKLEVQGNKLVIVI